MLKNLTLAGLALGASTLVPTLSSPSVALPGDQIVESRAYLHSFNVPAHGVAIQGYSPVSYFEGRAERGSALFAVEHRGVTYHLTSAEQVAAFRRAPQKYEPAFGGWCAFGMAISDKFPIDPTNFKIVDGRLMLFLRNTNVDALELWEQGDAPELGAKAAAHWKKVQG